jgi:hypothetical protein
MNHKLKIDTEYTPSPAESEKWVSPFVFLYKGKRWEVDRNLGVHEVKEEKHGH